MRSPVTCHVLDSAQGKPAPGIPVELCRMKESGEGSFHILLAKGKTDDDGRCTTLLDPKTELEAGLYKMTFRTGKYLEETTKQPAFFPFVEITFRLAAPDEHYHIPLLLAPHSYTTYRGS